MGGGGELVRVAAARNQAEAELVQGLLREEGVPSLVRRSGGFDVPDFLASGPRDVMVAAENAVTAREIIGVPGPVPAGPSTSPPWVRAMAAALAVLIVALVAAGVYVAIA